MNTTNKIAEQKALEVYPPCINSNNFDLAESRREGYIKGYDQAFQEVLEKACSFIRERRYKMNAQVQGVEYIIEQFKKYMKDESEN